MYFCDGTTWEQWPPNQRVRLIVTRVYKRKRAPVRAPSVFEPANLSERRLCHCVHQDPSQALAVDSCLDRHARAAKVALSDREPRSADGHPCPSNSHEALALNDHLTRECARDVFEVISIPFAGGDFTDVHSVRTASDVE
jgi:hypothetical protein